MKIIIVRHGESEENVAGILQGVLPGKLTDEGIKQSTKIGKTLANENIDAIYCSPVFRCKQTLEYIIKEFKKDIPITYTESLKERDFGKISGSSNKDINFEELDKDSKQNQDNGVESLESVRVRIHNLIVELKNKHTNDTVLIISHNNPLRMLFGEFLNMDYYQTLKNIKVENASISIFDIEEDKVTTVKINDKSHLS